MDSDRVEANLCNGGKSSSDLDLREVVDKEEEEEEGNLETNSLLPSAVNGGIEAKRQKNSRRKVQWNDRKGNKLVEVVEFQPRCIKWRKFDRLKQDKEGLMQDCINLRRFDGCYGTQYQ